MDETIGMELPFDRIFPSQTMPELHTLVIEGMVLWPRELSGWIFRHPKLKSIAFRKTYLQGHWQHLVRAWSEKESFELDAFELTSPWDWDVRDNNNMEGGPRILSRVSSASLLNYINCGGANPFESRSWRRIDGPFDVQDDDNDHLSDYSDGSEWKPEDHSDSEDPFGPEFNSDYDFDAEEESDDEAN